MIEKVTQALVEAIGAPKENVHVWIHDMPKENWGIAGVSAKEPGAEAGHTTVTAHGGAPAEGLGSSRAPDAACKGERGRHSLRAQAVRPREGLKASSNRNGRVANPRPSSS